MSLTAETLVGQDLVAEDHRIKQEHLYMKLLEQRISQLEAQIQGSVIPTSKEQVPEKVPESSNVEPVQAKAGAQDPSPTSEDQKGVEPATPSSSATTEKQAKAQADAQPAAVKESTASNRVRNITRKWNDDQDKYVDNESGVSEAGDTKEPTKTVTTFFRVMEEDNSKKLKNEKIEIESYEVRMLYFECCPNRDRQKHEQGETLELSSPFMEFVWYYDAFVKACEPQETDLTARKEAREDLKQLFQLVRKSSLQPYFKIRDTIETTGMIRYEHLWSIFPPGERVYCRPLAPKFSDWQMLEVDWYGYVGDIPNDSDPPKTTRLWLFGFDCDGTKFDKYSYTLKIRKFKDEKAIDTLEVFPKRFYRNAEKCRDDSDLQAELLERGMKWADLCATDARDSQHSYDGPSITYLTSASASGAFSRHDDETTTSLGDDDDDEGFTSITPDIHGKIIVDNYLFLRSERNEVGYPCPPLGRIHVEDVDDNDCQCRVCLASATRQWAFDIADDLKVQRQKFVESEERVRMCPPRILGYALKDKIWTQFRVKNIAKDHGKGGSHSFRHELQLEEKYKNTLMAFITNHESSRRQRTHQIGKSPNAMPDSFDIVEGKGKGLAILLHGAPGVGKTLTAETVALATGRPLLVVSVADLGTIAREAETRLNRIFNDAARWEAILLMDEADVFLEAREKTEDPNRNALVSVLLRCLEYYEGIIILTTNRIRSFDVAVQSRMHLAIQYFDLSKEHKIAIYKNLLDKIPKRHLDRELREPKTLNRCLDTLCRKDKINGRQIRNIVASAMALANYRTDEETRGVLTAEDLQDVYEMTAEFISSLNDDTVAMRRNNELGK